MSALICRAQVVEKVYRCVVLNGRLLDVDANYNTSTGDYTVHENGSERPFDQIFPPTGPDYAATQSWYINNEQLKLLNGKYVKYGLPRILGANEVQPISNYKGVTAFAEDRNAAKPEVIYIPVRSGCEFQPYQLNPGILH